MGKRGPVMSHSESRRRAEDALELRAAAYSYQEIADQLGFRHREGARRAVTRLLASTRRPTVAESRVESVESLRVLRRRLFDHLEVANADGDVDTATKVAREIRANLDSAAVREGLNAPVRTEVDVRVDPGQVLTKWFADLKAGHRPALPEAFLEAEVIES